MALFISMSCCFSTPIESKVKDSFKFHYFIEGASFSPSWWLMVKMDESNIFQHTVCVCVFLLPVCLCGITCVRLCFSVYTIHFFFFMCSRKKGEAAKRGIALACLLSGCKDEDRKWAYTAGKRGGKEVNRGMSREWEKWRKRARMTGETERERTEGSRRGQMAGRGERGTQNDTWIYAVSKQEKLWQD